MFLTSIFGLISADLQVAGAGPLVVGDTTIEGARMVTFRVEAGIASLSAARVAQPADFARNLLGFSEGDDRCSLFDLLAAAPCLTKRLSSDFGYMAQLVWVLAPHIEAALLGVSPVSGGEAWVQNSALVGCFNELTKHDRAPFAWAYMEATGKAMKQVDVLSVAVDDGRVGRSPWKLGAVLDLATNLAAWLLPQASRMRRSLGSWADGGAEGRI